MAKVHINDLSTAAALDGTELVELEQAGGSVQSTTQAIRNVKRTSYTTAQRDALTAENGMIIYNSDDDEFQGYMVGAWVVFDTTPV